jgi:hypothetical protein
LIPCSSFSIAFGFEILWNLAFGKSIESNRHHIVVGIGPCALSKHIIRLELIDRSTIDALLSPLLDPLEGLSMLNCEKFGLEGRSRLPTIKGGRGAC